jgi:DNA-binding transcriptional LysR family regulator
MLNSVQLSRVDLNLLVLFAAVFEERHVARAARRLNLSASAVSHGLRRLRATLNDPLFTRTPKGVAPTARAAELAGPVAEILARVGGVLATARPFDPATATRRFTIGTLDGISAVLLPPLLAHVRRVAPGIDISLRQLRFGSASAELDARVIEIAIAPLEDMPARFFARSLYEEEFVIAARAGHEFLRAPSLAAYCRMLHVVVSLGDDETTLVDAALARKGLSRRVVLFVPSFMQALAVVAQTDLVTAVPRRLAAMQAARFGLGFVKAPLALPGPPIRAIVPKAALMDAGLAWLLGLLEQAAQDRAVNRHVRRARP